MLREEGRRLRSVHQGQERVTPVVVGGRGDLDLLHHEGAVLVADQLVDEQAHGVAQHDLVVAPQEGHSSGRAGTHPAAAPRSSRAAEDGRHDIGGAARAPHVVGPQHAAAERDPERVRGMAGVPPVVDVRPDQMAEKPLVRGGEEQRPPERRDPVVGPEELERLRFGLAEVEPGVDHHAFARDPSGLGPLGPIAEEATHGIDDRLVVDGLGIGHAWPEADVRGHDGRAAGGGDGEVVGVGEPADVVADHRADPQGLPEHRGSPGVHRQGHVEAAVEGVERGDDPLELLCLTDLGTWAGLHPADVQEVGALHHELVGLGQEGVEVEVGALVEEGVGGPVEDAHDQRAVAHVEAVRPEGDDRTRRDEHHRPRPRVHGAEPIG